MHNQTDMRLAVQAGEPKAGARLVLDLYSLFTFSLEGLLANKGKVAWRFQSRLVMAHRELTIDHASEQSRPLSYPAPPFISVIQSKPRNTLLAVDSQPMNQHSEIIGVFSNTAWQEAAIQSQSSCVRRSPPSKRLD